MKKIICSFLSLAVFISCCLLIVACGRTTSVDIPYTILDWNSSPEDATDYHACAPSQLYDASGDTKAYVYDNVQYDGNVGKVTYFFTTDGELVATYFDVYLTEDNDITTLYNKYVDFYTEKYGDSDSTLDVDMMSGKVWSEDVGNIGVMCNNFFNKMVRIQYRNPKFTENN